MARILIAEDDGSMRTFLKRALERAGHEVSAVENGVRALPHLHGERFDLLLADIVMPDMDGIELSRRALEIDGELRIIFITGFAAVAVNHQPFDGRMAKVLSKPFHLKDLVNEIERTLEATA